MRMNRLRWFLLFLLVSSGVALPAQPRELDHELVRLPDRELLALIRADAEKGDAMNQHLLGYTFYLGNLGVVKDYAEAVKWYRKAAEQNYLDAECSLGFCYANGHGVEQDYVEAVKWYRKAAEQNHASAQNNLGVCYDNGQGVEKDNVEALKWYLKAAERNQAKAQYNAGCCFYTGKGVETNHAQAVKWFRKAAEQNHAPAQFYLGTCYANGQGVAKARVEGYKWYLLAAVQGVGTAKRLVAALEELMSQTQIAEGRKLAQDFKPEAGFLAVDDGPVALPSEVSSEVSGSGFFITEDGYLITSGRLASKGVQVRLVTKAGYQSAKVVKIDVANDLALLKTRDKFEPLPVSSSRTVQVRNPVATVGFPDISLQGFVPKMVKGDITALCGAQGDPRYFQISAPVQSGHSGGALVDECGNVVGVVSAWPSVAATAATRGALPENVNYAVKSSYLLSFLESVPEVAGKLKRPSAKERKFEEVVKSAEDAAVLVFVY